MKMREALVIAMKAICHHASANHTCDSLAWENSTINENCGDILCAHRDLCEAKTAIQKALSEPERNCDIYKTSGEANRAITEYCSKMAETGECVKSCPYRESKGGCAFGWILAAAGTKGEADGSK